MDRSKGKLTWVAADLVLVICLFSFVDMTVVHVSDGPCIEASTFDAPGRNGLKVIGWTFPWDGDPIAPMERWASCLDEVSPYWYWSFPNGSVSRTHPDSEDLGFIDHCNRNGIDLLPMVSNNHDPDVVSSICRDMSVQERHISYLVNLTTQRGYRGLDINYESIRTQDRDVYTEFIGNLSERLHESGMVLSVSVLPKVAEWEFREGPDAYDYANLSRYADELRIMAYNLHWSSCAESGPIESIGWVDRVLSYASSVVLPEKMVLGIPQFSYDWKVDKYGRTLSVAANRTFSEVMSIMEVHDVPREWNASSRTPFVEYPANDGSLHSIHYCDSESLYHELKLVDRYSITGLAFWKIGGEDPRTARIVDMVKGYDLSDLPPYLDIGGDLIGRIGSPIELGPVRAYDLEGAIENVLWDMGDGSTSDVLDAVHTYSSGGFYNVSLTVEDGEGNRITMSKAVRIGPYAMMRMEGDPAVGSSLVFNAEESWDPQGLVSYSWDLGDGSYLFHDSPVIEHTYTRPGEFWVELKVINALGYVDTDRTRVVIPDKLPPVADAGPDLMVWEDSTFELDARSSSDDSGYFECSWTLSTGEVLEGLSPELMFMDPMNLTATLTVVDGSGNSNTDSMRITVRDRTRPDIVIVHPGSAPLGTTVTLDASASMDNVGISQFIWDLGGGRTIRGCDSIELVLSEAKRYFVTLEVLDDEGNWNSSTVFIDSIDVTPPSSSMSISPSPVPVDSTYMADFSFDIEKDPSFLGTVLRNYTYLFNVVDGWDDSGIAYVRWSFGDGSFEGGPFVYHSYSTSGIYRGSLELIDVFNNTNTQEFSLLVMPAFERSVVLHEHENLTYSNTTLNVRPDKVESPLLENESIFLLSAGSVAISILAFDVLNALRHRRLRITSGKGGKLL